MNSEITLGYWGIRGNGQVSRLLLHYTGASWKNQLYTSPQQWFGKDKVNLGLHFANLPYLIDGDFKMTETIAIQRYIISISNKKQLFGKSLADQAIVDNIEGVFFDMRKALFGINFSENYKTELPGVLAGLKKKLGFLQRFYENKTFSLGYLTLADFQLAEFSYYIRAASKELYDSFPFLQNLRTSFEQLPEIKQYYAKQNAIKSPFMPPNANIKPEL